MKIVTFGPDRRTGVLRDETVVDISLAFAKYLKERQGERHPRRLANALCPPELGHFIDGGQRALDNAQKALDYLFSEVQHQKGAHGEKIIQTASEVMLHAPVPTGARIACAGGNFADHAAAMANRNRTGDVKPFTGDPAAEIRKTGIWGFWKITRDMVEPDGELIYPARCNRLDYEGELAIVIGKQGKDIRAKDVKDYIWGITLLGDWSVRGVAEPGPLRFAMQKNFDTCCSVGPCISVGEADALNAPVETYVNGERRQSFSTKDMVFSFGEYLEFLSRDMTFYPGDIISGGTAAGTAADSSPLLADGTPSAERFLKPGDTVEVKSPAVGTLRTRVVAKKNA
ncbi:MAG TPA: fumarylacetoacetate hydrolase family protein [Stellaceae bacterium]|nr:fumarylacetoacetate hydrolase family protein [Stellaceae bacterium]